MREKRDNREESDRERERERERERNQCNGFANGGRKKMKWTN